MLRAVWNSFRQHRRRRSSGVERALGKGEAVSSILTGGTIVFNDLDHSAFHQLTRYWHVTCSAPFGFGVSVI